MRCERGVCFLGRSEKRVGRLIFFFAVMVFMFLGFFFYVHRTWGLGSAGGLRVSRIVV